MTMGVPNGLYLFKLALSVVWWFKPVLSNIGDYSHLSAHFYFMHNSRVIMRRVNRTVTVLKQVCCNGYTNSSGQCVGKFEFQMDLSVFLW